VIAEAPPAVHVLRLTREAPRLAEREAMVRALRRAPSWRASTKNSVRDRARRHDPLPALLYRP